MARIVKPGEVLASAYQGLAAIFEFTNGDGRYRRTNCGQAAAATFLTHHGKFPAAAEQASAVMAAIERDHPPDNFGGLFGTSRRRVTRICRAHGLRLAEVHSEETLRGQLARANPVVVMLGVSPGRLFGRFDLPGGHWMVAYGFDPDLVYLTNYGTMTWEQFRHGWTSFVPRLIDMRHKGLMLAPNEA
jgi:hypothetical protein